MNCNASDVTQPRSVGMSGYEDSDQPAAAYSAAVAGWLQQVYHAQMMHYGSIHHLLGLSHFTSFLYSGFHSFLAYQAFNGRLPSQQQQQQQAAPSPPQQQQQQQQQQNINLHLNIPGVGNLNLNNNNGGAVPLLRATFVEVRPDH